MTSDRIAELSDLVLRKRCTHILVSDAVDVRAVCGFHASNVYLLVSPGRCCLCTDFRYRQAARRFCRMRRQWRFVEIAQGGFSFLAQCIRRGSTLGIQSESMTVDSFGRIRAVLRGVSLVKLPGAVPGLSVAKTPAEVAVIRRCATIGDAALAWTVRRLKKGITEREAAALLEDRCRRLGAEKMGFDTIVLFGPHTALPHGEPADRRLATGDWVLFDFGCARDGLCSDMTRTFVFGRAGARQRKIYAIVLRAQARARAGIRAGMRARDADRLARSVIAAAGYGNYFGHGTGHGVGYRVHEPPHLSRTSAEVLVQGAVVTVEPGIYLPGFGGVRIEDMVHLAGTGAEILTGFPRELIELGA